MTFKTVALVLSCSILNRRYPQCKKTCCESILGFTRQKRHSLRNKKYNHAWVDNFCFCLNCEANDSRAAYFRQTLCGNICVAGVLLLPWAYPQIRIKGRSIQNKEQTKHQKTKQNKTLFSYHCISLKLSTMKCQKSCTDEV